MSRAGFQLFHFQQDLLLVVFVGNLGKNQTQLELSFTRILAQQVEGDFVAIRNQLAVACVQSDPQLSRLDLFRNRSRLVEDERQLPS